MRSVRTSIGGLGNLMFKEAYIYTQLRRGLIPDLYVQSPKYWGAFAEDIKARFSEGIPPKTSKVSLHIRRGDYVNNSFYVDLSTTDYYQKAVKEFPNAEFLVFCKDNQNRDDKDLEWALAFMDSLGVKYTMAPRENSETDDLNLMASCESHIMANSTFSWWAAFLGGGKTIVPKQWFADGQQRIDLLPEWIHL